MCQYGGGYVGDDLVFFAVRSEVKAINRKGKEVYSFDTFCADSIKIVLVHGFKLWIVGVDWRLCRIPY